jgi:putative hydrolase of the HAD superfamily
MTVTVGVQALLIDLDGTLLDDTTTEKAVVAACEVLAQRSGVPAEKLAAANDAIWPTLWSEIEDPWMRGHMTGREVVTEAWRRAFAEVGIDDDELTRFAVETNAAEDVEAFRLYEDTAGLLSWARAAGLKTALVTNGSSDTQRTKILEMKLEELVDAVIVSGEVGSVKPEVGIFEHALDVLGVGAASALMIGDNLVNDIQGARAAGIRSVWINRIEAQPPVGEQPDFVITSLDELPALLDGVLLP